MSRFYCRDEELRKLNKRYENGKFECVVIYGRRRVGKTALINEFCKDKPTIFFSALNTTGKENLEALSKAIMSFERPNAESSPEFTTYDAALDELELIREYAAVFGKGANYHYYIFSKGGFTDGLLQAQERGEVQLLSLADIF